MAAGAAETISTETAKLNLGEVTDDDDDDNDEPFARDVEADLEEDEAVIEEEQIISTLASHYFASDVEADLEEDEAAIEDEQTISTLASQNTNCVLIIGRNWIRTNRPHP